MSQYLIRGAHLLTMADESQALQRGDLLIDGDVIAGVAPSIDAPGAEVIDGRDLIAMPGWSTPTGTCGRRCSAAAPATATSTTISSRSCSPTARRSHRRTRTRSVRFGLAEAVVERDHDDPRLGAQHPDPGPRARGAAGAARVRHAGAVLVRSVERSRGRGSFARADETLDFDDILGFERGVCRAGPPPLGSPPGP